MTNEERRVYRKARKYGYEIHKGNQNYFDEDGNKTIIRLGTSPTDEPERGYQIHLISNGDCVAGIEGPYIDGDGKTYWKGYSLDLEGIENFDYDR